MGDFLTLPKGVPERLGQHFFIWLSDYEILARGKRDSNLHVTRQRFGTVLRGFIVPRVLSSPLISSEAFSGVAVIPRMM